MPRIEQEVKNQLLCIAESAIEKCNTPKNERKAHWSTVTDEYLYNRLIEEAHELRDAMKTGTPEDVISECYDVINFALFIADNVKKRQK